MYGVVPGAYRRLTYLNPQKPWINVAAGLSKLSKKPAEKKRV
jgi:hypothetical protein